MFFGCFCLFVVFVLFLFFPPPTPLVLPRFAGIALRMTCSLCFRRYLGGVLLFLVAGARVFAKVI